MLPMSFDRTKMSKNTHKNSNKNNNNDDYDNNNNNDNDNISPYPIRSKGCCMSSKSPCSVTPVMLLEYVHMHVHFLRALFGIIRSEHIRWQGGTLIMELVYI